VHPVDVANTPKKVRKTGDVEQLKRKLWQAIVTAEGISLDAEVDAPTRLRAITALTQASMTFARLVEMTDMAGSLAKMERMMKGGLTVEELFRGRPTEGGPTAPPPTRQALRRHRPGRRPPVGGGGAGGGVRPPGRPGGGRPAPEERQRGGGSGSGRPAGA